MSTLFAGLAIVAVTTIFELLNNDDNEKETEKVFKSENSIEERF